MGSENIGKKCCGLCCREVYITRNVFRTQNLQLINESGFKSRAAYDGACMVYGMELYNKFLAVKYMFED